MTHGAVAPSTLNRGTALDAAKHFQNATASRMRRSAGDGLVTVAS
jgi:hypothetical protein